MQKTYKYLLYVWYQHAFINYLITWNKMRFLTFCTTWYELLGWYDIRLQVSSTMTRQSPYCLVYLFITLFSSPQWQKPSDHLKAALHNWSYQQIAVSRHQTGALHCNRSVITNTHGWRPKSTVAKTLTIGDKWDLPQKTQLFNTAVCVNSDSAERMSMFSWHATAPDWLVSQRCHYMDKVGELISL